MARKRQAAIAALITLGTTLVPASIASAAPVPAAAATPAVAAASAAPAAAPLASPDDPGTFVAPRATVKLGSSGAAVRTLQRRLNELGYYVGKVDGRYGGATQAAVWAFQKVQGLPVSSRVNRSVWRALENPKQPKALVPRGRPYRVEVNLTKQLMVLYRDGRPQLISHISSGSGIPYREWKVWNGKRQLFTGSARTPTGDFRTTWRRSGWHRSYLGELYNPIFFYGGIALHGSLSVPLYPASHGCVRLPMHVAQVLPKMLGTGVPVHVRGAFRRA
jgi:Putative peptidoglycan-binding domain-containing protein